MGILTVAERINLIEKEVGNKRLSIKEINDDHEKFSGLPTDFLFSLVVKPGDIVSFRTSSYLHLPSLTGVVFYVDQLGYVAYVGESKYKLSKVIDIKVVERVEDRRGESCDLGLPLSA